MWIFTREVINVNEIQSTIMSEFLLKPIESLMHNYTVLLIILFWSFISQPLHSKFSTELKQCKSFLMYYLCQYICYYSYYECLKLLLTKLFLLLVIFGFYQWFNFQSINTEIDNIVRSKMPREHPLEWHQNFSPKQNPLFS